MSCRRSPAQTSNPADASTIAAAAHANDDPPISSVARPAAMVAITFAAARRSVCAVATTASTNIETGTAVVIAE